METNKKEYLKAWYKANKEKQNTKMKEWREQNKTSSKEYYKENKDKWVTQNKSWYENNKEKKQALNKAYREANKGRDKNKEKINQWFKDRKQADPLFKLKQNIKSSIAQSFLKNKLSKNTPTTQILGCSFEELKTHIESQFEPWMNWENKGGKIIEGPNVSWDIDHIIPLNTAKTEDDVIRLNHYTNLRPLCSYQNRWVKREKIK